MAETINLPLSIGARDALIAMALLWVFFAAVLALRIQVRMRGPGLALDDIFAIIAFMLATSTIGVNAAAFVAGVGWDFDPTSPIFPTLLNNAPFVLQMIFVYLLIYIWCLAALKLSQLALYHRVFAQTLRISVYVTSGIVLVWAIGFTFASIFLCDPISQQWRLEKVGTCGDIVLLAKCLILTNAATDLMIFVLPIRSVWNLQMRKTEKLVVLACFGLGAACIFISVARFVLMFTIDLAANLTGSTLTTLMLCTIELMLAGLSITIPLLRPLYTRWRQKYSSSYGSKDQLKGSKSGQMESGPPRPGHYTQWIELDAADTTGATVTHDDASSQRKLTSEQMSDAIHVSKGFVITRS